MPNLIELENGTLVRVNFDEQLSDELDEVDVEVDVQRRGE